MEEEGEPDEFFDVLDILDGRADLPDDDESPVAPPRTNEALHPSFSEEEQEEEVDHGEGDHDMDAEEAERLTPSDDEADVDALYSLGQIISNLDSSVKRKNTEDVPVAEIDVPRKKRKLLKERNEAGAEDEFAAAGEL